MNVTQTALTIKSLAARMPFVDAVERTVPGADPAFWQRQVANLGNKPRKAVKRQTPRQSGKARQERKQAAAMAALVSRVNEREPVQDDFIPFDGRPMHSRAITARDEVL